MKLITDIHVANWLNYDYTYEDSIKLQSDCFLIFNDLKRYFNEQYGYKNKEKWMLDG